VLNSFSNRSYKLVIVFVASLMATGIACAQGAAGAGASEGTSLLPAQPAANANGADSSSASLPTAANAGRTGEASGAGAAAQSYSDNEEPITVVQRLRWVAVSTLGWQSLAWGVVSAGIGTAENHPQEYGTHWDGFADRYGIRLSGIVTSNVTEAGLGAIWGEDPRYKREPEKSFGGRVESVIYQTFFTRKSGGDFSPAYARFIAIPGSNFMSNTWRVKDEADTAHALERTGYGFAGAMGGNAFHEFWPDVKSHLFHHGD
jgi:hypothetical protein